MFFDKYLGLILFIYPEFVGWLKLLVNLLETKCL